MEELLNLKIGLKLNTSLSKHLRLEEKKSLSKGRIFRINSKREEGAEATKEQKEDLERSEAFYNLYQNFRHRRVHELRKIQRASFLAYAFLRGFEYSVIEDKCHGQPDFDLVERTIFAYTDEDPRLIKQQFEEWTQLAKAYIKETKGKK